MALFRTFGAAIQGIDAHVIDVEVDMYPSGTSRDFVTVGMPDAAVKERRERIKSALLNSGFGYPSKAQELKTETSRPSRQLALLWVGTIIGAQEHGKARTRTQDKKYTSQ